VRLLLQEGKARRGAALEQGAVGRDLLLSLPLLVLVWEVTAVTPLGDPGPSELPFPLFSEK